MRGLIAIHSDVATIGSKELEPGELTRCRLDRRTNVLGTAEDDAAQRIVRDRVEFRRANVAID